MNDEKFDFLVILNGLATNPNTSDSNSELIELNWCSYDLTKKSVNAESSYLIRPKNIREVNPNFLKVNHINQSDLEKSDDLLEVLKKFNIFIFETYTKNNFSFAFITKDDWLLGSQIKRESVQKGIKLGYHLDKYFDLIKEFKMFYRIDKINSKDTPDLKDLLQYLNLKQTEVTRPSMMELNTIVRIVNRIIKDGHQFRFKISSQNEENMTRINTEGTSKPISTNLSSKNGSNSVENEKQSENSKKIESRHNEKTETNILTWYEKKEFFFRIKNLPLNINEKEIKDLFYCYDLKIADGDDIGDIILSYDIFGRKTGEAVIKIHNELSLNEILSCYKFREYNKRLIDVVKTNWIDFTNCQKNLKFKSRSPYTDTVENTNHIFVKVKNLNYSMKEENIRKIFKEFIIAENGIKLMKNKKGNFLGEAMIAFCDPEEAGRAIREKNGETILNSLITVEKSNLDEFEEFASSNSFYATIKNLADYVTPENVQKCLYINNFPLDIDKEFLLKTFEIFNMNESNFIIDERNMMNYGCMIVIFLSEEDATFAKNYLKKKIILWKNRSRKLIIENLLVLVNKGNEL